MMKSQTGEHEKEQEKGMMEKELEVCLCVCEGGKKNKEMLSKRDNRETKGNNNDRGEGKKNTNLRFPASLASQPGVTRGYL